tara:strand:- start:225 stop:1073 length:849 start_codon:yes stop_codon:yes gene_type:complete
VPVYPRVKKTEQIRSLFQKVATTNHYEVFFSGFGSMRKLRGYITSRSPRVSNSFISRDLGLLCNSAELPATTMATSQIEGNRMGIVEKFAHSRVYTDSSFTFYVDSDYKVLEFFELWQEFIASGSDESDGADKSHLAYYHRMQYPQEYKVDTIKIQKFNKDHFRSVQYTFLNAFPVAVSAMPVSYDGNSVLECQVTFSYDRYFFGPMQSLDRRVFNSAYKQINTGPMPGNDPAKKEVTKEIKGDTSTTKVIDTQKPRDIQEEVKAFKNNKTVQESLTALEDK